MKAFCQFEILSLRHVFAPFLEPFFQVGWVGKARYLAFMTP
jgi:hypothetical protein